ncbi:glutathione synthetase [Talaromyces proteolyticus]|uniref:Glutathione synthetase n=1 Tax=Talaromyces proteolyticus TaxID=1131652 RepID=A0AAD4Q3D8_9EURO|nr:glutathione synthetase [Talaromyces proteolyticus]KAH8704949.1 glutathione synthetase [Talaromyces proteolyticus]
MPALSVIPDDLPPSIVESIITQIKDYQANHGSLIKVIGSETENSVLLHPIGVSVFPTLFPRKLFDTAIELQHIYNELYCKVAEDEEWLSTTTRALRKQEPLIDALWTVHEEVERRRRGNGTMRYPRQEVSAGVFRSDYMLHHHQDHDSDGDSDEKNWMENVSLKQVEFNAYSCAGGSHANKVVDMHRYLTRTNVYDFELEQTENRQTRNNICVNLSSLPRNRTIHGIASVLASAHAMYGPPKSCQHPTAVLMVVQPNNFNITDERPIEYALWNWEEGGCPIPTYRVEWQDVLQYTSLAETGELLFHPNQGRAGRKSVEVSVVYHRAGYETKEYADEVGMEIRIRLELSRAIKCPSILGHITTAKKVQQALVVPDVLERWLAPDRAGRIRETFFNTYPLDNSTPTGVRGRELATNLLAADNYILKPSLEGGGHNIYGSDIPRFLDGIPEAQWSAYILMERIRSPRDIYNVLMSSDGIVADEVVSELGIFGTCLWKSTNSRNGGSNCEVILNNVGGWSFKTKDALVDEMSVVKGYGCFDTPCLVDTSN